MIGVVTRRGCYSSSFDHCLYLQENNSCYTSGA